MLLAGLLVGPDADLFDEHADKPATSAAAAMAAAATDLARSFLIAFGSFVAGGLVPPSVVGQQSFGNIAGMDGSGPGAAGIRGEFGDEYRVCDPPQSFR